MSLSDSEYVNRIMVKVAPELSSEYARYPMKRDRWLLPKEKGPKGEACFLSGPDVGIKKDYVYGPGACGRGYYSLLCKDPYRALHARLHNSGAAGVGCCAFSKEAKQAVDEHDTVKRLMYLRGHGRVPDDLKCREDAVQSGMYMGPHGF